MGAMGRGESSPNGGKQCGVEIHYIGVCGRTRMSLVVTAACLCSCIYAFFLVFISTKPCWNSARMCENRPCESGNASILPSHQHFHLQPGAVGNSTGTVRTMNEVNSTLRPVAAVSVDWQPKNTSLSNIVFGIAASAHLWKSRKQYVKEWWKPGQMRGYVWLEEPVQNETGWGVDVPLCQISANTSQFKYTHKIGSRSAIRLARIVTEMYRFKLPEVDWFVMGDDDTIFFTDNLVRMLSKYNPSKMYYIGSQSESHWQNTEFSYGMAYGGGGFAISFPLAKALSGMQDDCLHRYPQLFGSDDRMHACITELGVPIIKNKGFHQFDIFGDPLGLMAAHPLTPLLSVHHLDVISPIFPNMSKVAAVQRLMNAAKAEQASMLQQTIVYGRHRKYSFSISSGYVVRAYAGFVAPWELEEVPRTFRSWYGDTARSHFPFNTREIPTEICKQPTLFYVHNRTAGGLIETVYVKADQGGRNLTDCDSRLQQVENIRVRSQPLDYSWFESRRLCGRVASWKNSTIDIHVRACQEDELIIGS
ncbi:hypothetical protein KC19_7G010900 [Ceratodon purpureus]|uniref:Uncharacterized protein n=1 Tax=Ceratodon purpureus TaxID=3225 RepID=A0A8T0H5S3_CERPU|nr:hypothetical protein KC19_7G010900 [Ceratodon purpureus]